MSRFRGFDPARCGRVVCRGLVTSAALDVAPKEAIRIVTAKSSSLAERFARRWTWSPGPSDGGGRDRLGDNQTGRDRC